MSELISSLRQLLQEQLERRRQRGFLEAAMAACALVAAADGERFEHSELYPGFARVARDEGFDRAADTWEAIRVSEKQHEKRYRELAANIMADRVFTRPQKTVWRCRNCGYLHTGTEAPEKCPACVRPRDNFELLGENW